jgi:PAS domain S-box-containing protein
MPLDLDRIREEAMEFAHVGLYRLRMDGSIVFMDRECVRLLDLSEQFPDPSALIGRHIHSLLVTLEDPELLRNAVKERGRVRDIEYHFRTLTGKDRWTHHDAYLVHAPDGELQLQIIAKDITAFKHATLRLEASEKRYRTLAEDSSLGICVLSPGYGITFVNRAFATQVARSVEALLAFDEDAVQNMLHAEDFALLKAAIEDWRAGLPIPRLVEVRALHPDGTLCWLSTVISAIVFDEHPSLQFTTTDITERKQAQLAESERLAQQLESQKLESLGVLAGGVAHDFNNLLAAILGNAELARMELAEPLAANGHIEHLVEAANQAAGLCQQLLSYAGRSQLQSSVVQLNTLVQDSLSLLRLSASRRAQLELDLQEGLPLVHADSVSLRQVLLNLVHNAAEALGEQPGCIRISTAIAAYRAADLLRVQGSRKLSAGDYVRLSVEDDGPGMDQETARCIFDPFFTTKFTGRGLGLASVLGIVGKLGGGIELETAPGFGARFNILLRPSQEAAEPQHPRSALQLRCRQGRVLLADDEPMLRHALGQLLQNLGFEVELACDGADAVQRFEARPDGFCLLVFDLTMPVMDGATAARKIREIAPEVPILFSSGFDAGRHDLALPRSGFLHKTYRLQTLIDALVALLDA